jgi:hypothetical protein
MVAVSILRFLVELTARLAGKPACADAVATEEERGRERVEVHRLHNFSGASLGSPARSTV